MNQFVNFPSQDIKGCRDGMGEALVVLGEKDQRIVALTADLAESTRVHKFAGKFPERFFDVGVAEQNMMGLAAGLALAGKIPFIASYAVFSPGRSWDQFRVSVCYSNTNVKVMGAHAGISVGADGATHQALEDLAMVRVLPNITVIVPADYEETKKATLAAAAHPGPVYIRFGRENTPAFTTAEAPFTIGKANILREGKDVTIFGCGPLLYRVLTVAEKLADTIDCEVINVHTLKPLDIATILLSVRKTGAAVTVEEHQIIGGLHGAIAEAVTQNWPVPVEAIGVPDQFGESGTPEELLDKYGMSLEWIKEAVMKVYKRKKGIE